MIKQSAGPAGAAPLLASVRVTRARAEQWQQRHYQAIASAFSSGVNRDDIAEAAGITRDAVYKVARRITEADTRQEDYRLVTIKTDAAVDAVKDISIWQLGHHIGVEPDAEGGTEITTVAYYADELAAKLREHGHTARIS